MWDLPGPGLEPVSPASAGGFFTTAPPGESLVYCFQRSFMLLCESVLHSFFIVEWYSVVMNMPHFAYSLISWWVCGPFPLFGSYEWAAVNIVYRFLCGRLISFLLRLFLRVELPGHTVTPCVTFWGTARLFSKVAVSLYVPTHNVWVFQFLHILTSTCHHLSKNFLSLSCKAHSVACWVGNEGFSSPALKITSSLKKGAERIFCVSIG